MQNELGPPNLTVQDVVLYLNVSESTVRRLLKEGRLEAIRVRSCVRINLSSVMEFEETNRYLDIKRRQQSYLGRFGQSVLAAVTRSK